jgi:hypothetical protein
LNNTRKRIKAISILLALFIYFHAISLISLEYPALFIPHLFYSCQKQNFHALEGFDSTALQVQKEYVRIPWST